MLKLLIGNRRIYDYELRIDGDLLGSGDAVDNALESITAGTWVVKEKPTDANEDALVRVTYDVMVPVNSPNFLLNTPDSGWVRVIVPSSGTSGVTPGRYYMALQLEWGSDNKQEFIFDDGMIELCQDIVR